MTITKIITFHTLFFIALVCYFVFAYDYPVPILPISFLVIACIYLAIFWVIGFLGIAIPIKSTFMRGLMALLLTAVGSSIVFVYLLNFVGNSNWGTNVTFKFIIQYAQELPKLEGTLPIPLVGIYGLLLLFIGLMFSLYFRLSKVILKKMSDFKLQALTSKLSFKEYSYLVLSFLIIPFTLFIYSYSQTDQINDMWDGEPLTDLLLPHTTITLGKTQINPKFMDNNYIATNIDNKPNVILIIADALRADHLKPYGYKRSTSKFIDHLLKTKQAIKVENAFSTCAESNCGILSTLSSRPFNEIDKNNIKVNNVLKGLHYDVNFILSADHNWSNLKSHYPPHDVFHDGSSQKKYTIIDDQLVLDRLDKIPNYKKPAFFYFHLMSNHPAGIRKKAFAKYKPYKSDHDWFYKLPLIKNFFISDRNELDNNFYDNGIVSTDFYISKIFEQLTQKGYMKNSIVWIIADHGEAIGEHGHYGHIKSLYNEETRIPMIIVDSKPELYKERFFATQLDVAPTILDRLGIEPPKSWKGTSLLKKKEGTFVSLHNVPDRKGDKAVIIKTDDNLIYKMLFNDKDVFKIKGIFNLTKDMAEKHDLNKPSNELLIEKLKSYAKQQGNNHTIPTKVVKN